MAKYQDSVEVVLQARNEAAVEMRKAEQDAKAATDRETQRMKRTAQERAQVEKDIRETSLRSQGRHLELQTEQIRDAHNRRIRAALDANDMELADRIATLRDMRIAEQKSANERGALVRNVMENHVGGAAVKATASFGLMELGLGGVNTLAKVLGGNLEDAAEAVKQLPAGIGPFARQLDELLGSATGIRDEIERIEAVNRAMELSIDRQKAAQDDILKIARDRAEVQRNIRNEIELAMAAESQRGVISIRQQEDERLRSAREALSEAERLGRAGGLSDEDRAAIQELSKAREKLESGGFLPSLADTIATYTPLGRLGVELDMLDSASDRAAQIEGQLTSIRNAERQILIQGRQRAEAAIEAARERLALEQQAIEVARQRRQEDEANDQAEAQRVMREKEIAEEQKRLAQQERELERARIAEEREAQRRELAQLREQRSAAQDRIRELRDEQRELGRLGQPTPENTADQNRFLSGVSERSAERDRRREDREREAIRQRDKQIEQLEALVERLTLMEEELRQGARVVGGNVFERTGE